MDEPQLAPGVVLSGLELSTGRKVDLALGELEQFYLQGEIPNDLLPIAARELFEENPDPKKREHHYRERFKLARWLASENLRNQTSVTELFAQEIWELWRYGNSPALALRNFRAQQEFRVGTVPGQQALGTEAEQPLSEADQ